MKQYATAILAVMVFSVSAYALDQQSLVANTVKDAALLSEQTKREVRDLSCDDLALLDGDAYANVFDDPLTSTVQAELSNLKEMADVLQKAKPMQTLILNWRAEVENLIQDRARQCHPDGGDNGVEK